MAPNTDIATRALIVGLKSAACGKTTAEVHAITGVPKRTIQDIFARAVQRGFDPNLTPVAIHDEYLEDAPRLGRPKKQTEEAINATVQKVCRDRYGREKSCADIAGELDSEGLDISAVTIWRILKQAGYKKTKPTRKPRLTKKMRDERLA
jgi:transposase